jgi:hypothetical protein
MRWAGNRHTQEVGTFEDGEICRMLCCRVVHPGNILGFGNSKSEYHFELINAAVHLQKYFIFNEDFVQWNPNLVFHSLRFSFI